MLFLSKNSSLCGASGPLDEIDLVIRAQARDESAFEELYNKYCGPISGYLTRKSSDKRVGDELTQEVFLKAWKSLPSLREVSKFPGWLYRIATTIWIDYLRRSRSKDSENSKGVECMEEISIAGPEEEVVARENLMSALACLSKIHRDCLILYRYMGLSLEEVAERLGIQPGTVKTYASKALGELRQHLSAEHKSPRKER